MLLFPNSGTMYVSDPGEGVKGEDLSRKHVIYSNTGKNLASLLHKGRWSHR